VPPALFISGGGGSSTTVAPDAAAKTRGGEDISIGFPTKHYNEAEYAAAVARHMGGKLTRSTTSRYEEGLKVIHQLPTFTRSIFGLVAYPTYIVSALARRYVTGGLYGTGGV